MAHHTDFDPVRLPHEIVVTSASRIKVDTTEKTLRALYPDADFTVKGIKAPSGVSEQPVGQETLTGALNRLRFAMNLGGSATRGYLSIENGIFRTLSPSDNPEDIDMTQDFDPAASYADRAVVALHLPRYPLVVQISHSQDAVPVPSAAILAAYNAPGGFAENTAGSILAKEGLVRDMQNPHIDLTHGALSREQQIDHVLRRALNSIRT